MTTYTIAKTNKNLIAMLGLLATAGAAGALPQELTACMPTTQSYIYVLKDAGIGYGFIRQSKKVVKTGKAGRPTYMLFLTAAGRKHLERTNA